MDRACQIDSSWSDEFTDQQVGGYQKVSKDKHGPETHPEKVDGLSVTDDFYGQKVIKAFLPLLTFDPKPHQKVYQYTRLPYKRKVTQIN